MELIESAKELAKHFRIFPLAPLSKVPPRGFTDFATRATTDLDQIEKWWKRNPNYNVGISTDEFVAVDIDNKDGKKGSDELLRLARDGKTLEATFEQITPTGGHHLLYSTVEPVRLGVNVLAPGIDIRGRGGYLVGAGSRLSNGIYTCIPRPVRPAPEWLLAACKRARSREDKAGTVLDGIDPQRAIERATRYLLNEAPLSVKGQGGDATAFKVAARVKDFGVDADTALILMLDHWNDRCPPGWAPDRLREKVQNAYGYGNEPIGVADPGVEFDEVILEPSEILTLDPIVKMNQEYKYIAGSSGFILQETRDYKGRFSINIINVDKFHQNLAAQTMVFNGKTQPITQVWIKDPRRETYDSIQFAPEKPIDKRFYNLWRGFTVKPLPLDQEPTPRSARALEMWITHARENICQGDEALAHWLISYFAHMIQKPWEKPLVAIVLRGGKGLGKSAFVGRVRYLFGQHAGVVSHRHKLTGNFNSVLENKIFLTLEEAFWSGDKSAEGVLKELITGDTHSIERKGQEAYEVDNCLRLAVLGNDSWVVPASADERRYAVFNVTKGQFKDSDFQEMREAMESSGYRLLLRYLQTYDFSGINFSRAPKSQGLLEQKLQSLTPLQSWWHDCLNSGRILGSPFCGWPEFVGADQFRLSLQKEMGLRNVKARLPGSKEFLGDFRKCCFSVKGQSKRLEGEVLWTYTLPPLSKAREEWETYIGHKETWETEIYSGEDLIS